MSQYREGTVDVTNASAVVVGVATEWLANVSINDLFSVTVAGEDVLYTIASVDTDLQITLSIPFPGTTDTGLTYAILRDFSTNGYPLMNLSDIFLPQIFNDAMAQIDSDIRQTPSQLPVDDSTSIVQDPVDPTRQMRIDVGSVATATTRILFMPNVDVDLEAPPVSVRRAFAEPITGDALSGTTNPFDPATMLGEMLQCDNSGGAFQLQMPAPGSITGWDGPICFLRTTSGSNLASVTVPTVGDWAWQNGYPGADQNVTTLYLGLSQEQANGLITPVFMRSVKFSVIGNVRSGSAEDLTYQFGQASADARGGVIKNYLLENDDESGAYTFVQADAGGTKEFTGSVAANWTVPALTRGTDVTVHNIGTASVTFVSSGVTFQTAEDVLPPDGTAVLSWLTAAGTTVKVTGETTT